MYQSAKQVKRFKSRISAKHTKIGTSVSKTSYLRLLRPKPKVQSQKLFVANTGTKLHSTRVLTTESYLQVM